MILLLKNENKHYFLIVYMIKVNIMKVIVYYFVTTRFRFGTEQRMYWSYND